VSFAYVDTSCLVAIAFDEPEAARTAARLRRFERLFSSNVLEAELRSALRREGVEGHGLHLLSRRWATFGGPISGTSHTHCSSRPTPGPSRS
jgi:uncharacterized protein with PIN domain